MVNSKYVDIGVQEIRTETCLEIVNKTLNIFEENKITQFEALFIISLLDKISTLEITESLKKERRKKNE